MSAPKKPLTPGTKFGFLEIVKELPQERFPGGVTHYPYECKCQCGKIVKITRSNLRSCESTSSCGCVRNENSRKRLYKGPGYGAITQVWDYYFRNAKRRELSWNLNRKQFEELIRGSCFYCGAVNSMLSKKHKESILHNGIDRVNPDLGYILENCVSCCKICNCAKASLTLSEFYNWIKLVSACLGNRLSRDPKLTDA